MKDEEYVDRLTNIMDTDISNQMSELFGRMVREEKNHKLKNVKIGYPCFFSFVEDPVRYLNEYNLHFEVRRQGEIVTNGQLDSFVVAPGETSDVDVSAATSFVRTAAVTNHEFAITFKLTLKEDTAWAKTGHVVAWEQIKWPHSASSA